MPDLMKSIKSLEKLIPDLKKAVAAQYSDSEKKEYEEEGMEEEVDMSEIDAIMSADEEGDMDEEDFRASKPMPITGDY